MSERLRKARARNDGSRSSELRASKRPGPPTLQRSGTPAQTVQWLQDTIGNRAVQQLLSSDPHAAASEPVQRRVDQIPTSRTLKSQAPTEWTNPKPYKKTLDTIDNYYKANATDYGQQLVWLDELKSNIVGYWKLQRPDSTTARDKQRHRAVGTVNDTLPQEQAGVQDQALQDAMQKHHDDRETLRKYLAEALWSPDRRVRNSASWILQGKADLYAVTPTGDSDLRLKLNKMNPAKDEAFFPSTFSAGDPGHIMQHPILYNWWNPTDTTNVELSDNGKSTGGWNRPGIIAIVRPAATPRETVWEVLVHEVQHDADMNKGREARAGQYTAKEQEEAAQQGYEAGTHALTAFLTANPGEEPDLKPLEEIGAATDKAAKAAKAEEDLARYKTEYRAYSYEGSNFAKLDNKTRNQTHEGHTFTVRQLEIFKHIYNGYPYVKKAWDANSRLSDGRTYRQAVSAYYLAETEGFNPYNSPRLNDFYKALDAIGTKKAPTLYETRNKLDIAPVDHKVSDVNDAGVKDVLDKIGRLDADDADDISSSPDLLNKLTSHLEGDALKAVADKLAKLPRKPAPRGVFS